MLSFGDKVKGQGDNSVRAVYLHCQFTAMLHNVLPVRATVTAAAHTAHL